MIVVLDPAYFSRRGHDREDEQALRGEIRAMITFMKVCKARLIAVDDYWRPLWSELIQPLTRRCPRLSLDLAELRKRAISSPLDPSVAVADGRVWGFVPMFDRPDLDLSNVWADRMATSIIRLHLSHPSEPIVLFTRPVEGRNLRRHRAGNSTIDEPTRWRLYIQPRTARPVAVPCVVDRRQIDVPWTARFDRRLPGTADGARYPFCPPAAWWKRSTQAVRTHTGKPAFIDACGCGWARPNIPGGAGYHWDVYLSDRSRADAIGLDQINVVAHGGPATEGTAGDLHHVPADKRHLVNDCGWQCT